MVRPVEFESTTPGLKGRCSTVELRTHYWKNIDNLSYFLRLSMGNLAGIGFEPMIFTLWAWRDDLFSNPQNLKNIDNLSCFLQLSSGLSRNFKLSSTICCIQRTRSIYHTFTDCQGEIWSFARDFNSALRFTKPLHRHLCLRSVCYLTLFLYSF